MRVGKKEDEICVLWTYGQTFGGGGAGHEGGGGQEGHGGGALKINNTLKQNLGIILIFLKTYGQGGGGSGAGHFGGLLIND